MKTTSNPSKSFVQLAELSGLSSAYFGMVMATGIVWIATHLLGMLRVAKTLFGLNCLVYILLWGLTVLRVSRYPQRFVVT